MSEHATVGRGTSAIEWTEETWNPVTGCDRVSPGCAHCYALTLAKRLKAMGQPHYQRDGDPRTSGPGFGVSLHPDALEIPLRWRRPRVVFVNSMSDLFHEEIPYEFITRVWDTMQNAHQHVFQVLTKRPERALEWFRLRQQRREERPEIPWAPLVSKNVWLGVSIENARYTWRADVLREIPAAVRFISAEPLLGSLLPKRCGVGCFPDIGGSYVCGRVKGHPGLHASRFEQGAEWTNDDPGKCWLNVEDTHWARPLNLTGIDWLIVGGESGGRDARPMHPEWARELRDACLDVCGTCLSHEGVQPNCSQRPALFFKQWGSWSPDRPDGFGGVSAAERGRRIRTFEPDGTPYDGRGNDSWQRSTTMYYHGAGPKSGGRLLDGREWSEMPR